MKKRRIAWLVLTVFPLAVGGFAVTDRITFDRSAWLADYAQLKHDLPLHYANLKWAESEKHVDLPALAASTQAALAASRSNREARSAIATFLSGFHDAHLHVQSGPPRFVTDLAGFWPAAREPRIDFRMSAPEVCEALGFKHARNYLRLDHPRLAENKSAAFAAGRLELANGKRYGIIRIPAFQQYEYGASCEQAWEHFRSARSGLCDADCQDAFSLRAKHQVAAQLASEARRVSRDAEALIVDLTGNGGGTEWAEYAAAALSPRQLVPPKVAFVRSPHWARAFEADIALLAADSRRPLNAEQRSLVDSNLAIARALRDSALATCPLEAIWQARAARPACSNSVAITAYRTTSNAALVNGLASAQLLLDPQAELLQRNAFNGRVIVMVDQLTASASEYFAAILQDNGVAKVIGTRTLGAGCGYTNGGNPMRLANSGLVIEVPDCARLRPDGGNEYAGITPDLLVDWGSSEASKGVALEKALSELRW